MFIATGNFRLFVLAGAAILAIASSSFSQGILINEVEIDPPSNTSDACQYLEVRGPAGSTVPAGTYFASINSDLNGFGSANLIINLSGMTFGSNGTLTLVNTFSGPCPGRTYAAGTNLVTYTSTFFIGGGGVQTSGSETFLIFQSSQSLASGSDLDTDDDGVFDANRGITAVLDGFALLINPKEEYVYGAESGVVNISNTTSIDQPDAVTRFPGNTTPFATAAFYFGELSATPDSTNDYSTPLSPNFPMGGMLTPGGANAPSAPKMNPNARLDFDGDGRSDLAVFRPSEGIWYLQGSTQGFSALRWGASGDQLIPGDFDGDGRADTAVFRPSDQAGTPDFWVLGSNGFVFTGYEWGGAGDVAVPADLDGDDKTDIVVYRPTEGNWYVINSGAGTSSTTQFGQLGDIPLVFDAEGDGTDNFAVFRPSENNWYIARATGVPSQNFDAVPFGTAGDRLVPGDFDGDSKTDVAVFRSSIGQWIIRRSSDLSVSFVDFGVASDVPVVGDYDGDGKDDIAVFRNGVWYVNRSTAGLEVRNFGLSTDTVVASVFSN